ncbi:hypothetical protein ACQ4PT_019137 [Festuca glaucescens]
MPPRRRLGSPGFRVPPHHHPRSVSSFRAVRQWRLGRYAPEITHDGERWWMGTFDHTEEAAHAYDLAAFRSGLPAHFLNFPDMRDEAGAKFVAPDGIHFISMEEEMESR